MQFASKFESRLDGRQLFGSDRRLALVFCGWLLLSLVGFSILFMHDVSSVSVSSDLADANELPAWTLNLVSSAAICSDSDEFHLFIAVHPKCPCSVKSVEALRLLLLNSPQTSCTALVFAPEAVPSNWFETSTMAALQRIDGIDIVHDANGSKSQELNLIASGAVLLTNLEGKVLFRGGITASRGCDIDSAGSSSVAALLAHKVATVETAPIYGCKIIDTCPN